ncbi:hypothetical protein ACQJBY_048118 [Aegilops geniculata]
MKIAFDQVKSNRKSCVLRDKLINVGPLKDFSYGLRVNADANATGNAKQSNYELASGGGDELVTSQHHSSFTVTSHGKCFRHFFRVEKAESRASA